MRTPPVSPDPASLAPGDGLGTPQQPLSRTSTIRTTNSAKMTVRTGTLTTLPEMTEQPDREVGSLGCQTPEQSWTLLAPAPGSLSEYDVQAERKLHQNHQVHFAHVPSV